MPTTTGPQSRRALLTAGFAAAAAAFAAAVGRPQPVRGADGGPLIMGYHNRTSTVTTLRSQDGETGLRIVNDLGIAFRGESASGAGIIGESEDGIGLRGVSRRGYALQVAGPVAFRNAGVYRIAPGSTGGSIDPGVDITPQTFILLSPMADLDGRDLWATTSPKTDTFRINLSAPHTSVRAVAWFVGDRLPHGTYPVGADDTGDAAPE